MKVSLLGVLALGLGLSQAAVADGKNDKRPVRGSLHLGGGSSLARPSAGALALSEAFSSVAKHVSPWVVSVYTSRTVEAPSISPFLPFLGPEFGNQAKPESRKQEGGGSGFVVDPEGYVLTNAHVVKDMEEIKVELSDRTRLDAQVVGVDEKSDVALLKLPARKGGGSYVSASFADSDSLRIGEIVLAIGNPFLFRNTVTMGIVSATGRTEGASRDAYADYIQTDAAVNPGNSGGPLVNLRGEVVGINSSIWSRSGGYQGISFAIPINQARRIAEDLAYDGKVSRGWLGVGIEDVDPELAEALGIEGRNGAKIVQVNPGTPAARAGLQAGDVVLAVDGHAVTGSADLRNRVALLRPNQKVPFKVLRDGKEMTISVTVGRQKGDGAASEGNDSDEAVASQDADGSWLVKGLGVRLSELDDKGRERTKVERDMQGALLKAMPNSAAAEKGITEEWVLTMLKRPEDRGFQPVKSAKDAVARLEKLAPGSMVALKLRRGDETRLMGLRVAVPKERK